jgi:hypothetical protein
MEQLTPEQQKQQLEFEKMLDINQSVEFTKRQLIFIINVLTKVQLVHADWKQANPIIEIIEPLIKIEPPTEEIIK